MALSISSQTRPYTTFLSLPTPNIPNKAASAPSLEPLDFPPVSASTFCPECTPAMLTLLFALLPLLPLFVSSFPTAGSEGPSPAGGAAVCNGHAEYCALPYPSLAQVGSHNSAFVGLFPTQNQHQSVADQLGAGIRFLQAQTHRALDDDDVLELCHTSCLAEDAGSVLEYLRTVKGFLDANPAEVVTVLLTNADDVDAGAFDGVMREAGIKDYAFVPSEKGETIGLDEWPTIGEMVDSGKRLVFFLDYHASPATYPHILDEFAYFFETPFGTTDKDFPQCDLDRPAGASADGRMYIVNHFLNVELFGGIKVPDVANADRTNAATGDGSIGAQVDLCRGKYGGRNPKVVLLDYVDKGDVFAAERAMNGV